MIQGSRHKRSSGTNAGNQTVKQRHPNEIAWKAVRLAAGVALISLVKEVFGKDHTLLAVLIIFIALLLFAFWYARKLERASKHEN